MSPWLEMKSNLAFWRFELALIKRSLSHRRRLASASKAGFRQDQLRDTGGRWTTENGIQVATTGEFWTGIPAIDNTSSALSDTLTRVMATIEYLPSMSPSLYGTLVHAAFGFAVKMQNLPGVGDIERSFSLDEADPTYGLAGTIRTDVTLRDIQGDIIAIYDVKTGDRRISQSRANELRQKTGASPNTPVFELNVLHGNSRKAVQPLRYRSIDATKFYHVFLRRM